MKLNHKRLALIIAYCYLSTLGVFHRIDVMAADRMITSLKNIDPTANRIYQQIKVPDLPDQKLWRLGLTVDETIMADPKKATLKGMGVSKNEYLKDEWIGCQSSFYAQYLLEKGVGKGQIDISIVNAPSPQAAFEYLIVHACNSTLPDEAIVFQFADESIVSELGTIGYLSDGRGGDSIYFIRDNIAVIIRGYGEFEREVMDIARKIDAKLLQQPLLSYEQLQARRPKLHIGPGKKTTPRQTPFLEYSIEAPAGMQAYIRDMTFNGKAIASSDNKVYLEEKPKTVKVEATLVTSELLAFPFETEIEMPDEPQ